MLNFEDLKNTYQIELKNNILGQSRFKYFYYLKGIETSMYHMNKTKEDIETIQQEVFEQLIENGYEENVKHWINGDFEKIWGEE